LFFFFQAEDGIRDDVRWLEFRRVLFRSRNAAAECPPHREAEATGVEGEGL